MIKQAVILAAGESSRFWPLNSRHKSLIKVMGKPLIFYTIKSLQKAGFSEIIVVQGKEKDIQEELTPFLEEISVEIKYVIQEEPRGMGNALWQAREFLKDKFLVLNAERIDAGNLVTSQKSAIEDLEQKGGFAGILFGQKTNSPHLFGVMELEGERVVQIIEKPEKGKEPSNIRVVGVYILGTDFFEYYKNIEKQHHDFEAALSAYIKKKKIRALLFGKKKSSPPLKYPWHLFNIQGYLLKRYLKRKTEPSAKIIKGASIQGRVYIGKNTRIYKYAVIKGPCYIGDNCIIGNHTLIRENVNIEEGSVIGAYTEVARSNLQKAVHLHSNFIGDSILDKNCRIGAGTVTANVRIDRGGIKPFFNNKKIESGLNRLGVIIGENTNIGINCSLMPGTLIGADCLVGPGSLLKGNLSDNKVFYSQQE